MNKKLALLLALSLSLPCLANAQDNDFVGSAAQYAGLSVQVQSYSEASPVRLVVVGQTHWNPGAENDPLWAERIRTSQDSIEVFFRRLASTSGGLPVVYLEAVADQSIPFVQSARRICQNRNASTAAFLSDYPRIPIAHDIARLVESRRSNAAIPSDVNLRVGAVWKLYCEGVVDIRPAEDSHQYRDAILAQQQIEALRSRLINTIADLADLMTEAEYAHFQQEKRLPRNDNHNNWMSDFEALAENITHPGVRQAIVRAVQESLPFQRVINEEREAAVLVNVLGDRSGPSTRFIVFGSNHQFRSTRTNIVRIALAN